MSTEGMTNPNSTTASPLKDLFIEQLQELYWAEKKLAKCLGMLAEACNSSELKDAFIRHQEQTRQQAKRLERAFQTMNEDPDKSKCAAMAGILTEIENAIDNTEKESYQRDVALILAIQKAKHYEIASYGGLAQLAKTMGNEEAKAILCQTLEEEKQTDTLLTLIAEGGINEKASREDDE